MRSLRSRLLALWIMLVVSGVATAYLLVQSFRQTSNARVARAEELVARACRDIADRFQSSDAAAGDDRGRQQLAPLVQDRIVGHFLGQGVFESVLDLGNRGLLVEKFRKLQIEQRRHDFLVGLPGHFAHQSQPELLANHRHGLKYVLFGRRQPIDA
jgi:hypothetical protein